MKKTMQNRLKSPVFWAAALLLTAHEVMSAFGVYAAAGLEGAWLENVARAVATLAALFGAANDPTNKNGF